MPPRGVVLALAGLLVQVMIGERPGRGLMPGLGGGEIAQQAAGGGVLRAGGGAGVEGARLALHLGGLVADRFQAEILHQPDRAAGMEARDMLAPQQRDHLAEPGAVQRDELAAMRVLLGGHALEHRRRGREIGAQPLGIEPVDPRVILLRGDRQREDLLLAEIVEPATRDETGNHDRTLS